MDINRLPKNYATISAVWIDYPNGGREGDYFYLTSEPYPATPANTKYRWNKYAQVWEAADAVIDESARETTTFSDLHVQNDLHVGGVLAASSIKTLDKGMFESLADLNAAYPHPEKGWYAAVVNNETSPASLVVYLSKLNNGVYVWTSTGAGPIYSIATEAEIDAWLTQVASAFDNNNRVFDLDGRKLRYIYDDYFIARLQGTSSYSNAKTDPFVQLGDIDSMLPAGSTIDDKIAKLNEVLDNLLIYSGGGSSDYKPGNYRISVSGIGLDVKTCVLSYDAHEWLQVVTGPVYLRTGQLRILYTTDTFRSLQRKSSLSGGSVVLSPWEQIGHNDRELDEKVGSQSVVVTMKNMVMEPFQRMSYLSSALTAGYLYGLAGSAAPASPEPNGDWSCFRTPVVKGQMYKLTTFGSSNARAYALTDTSRNILSVAVAEVRAFVNELLVVNNDGYLYVNCRSDYATNFRLERFKPGVDGLRVPTIYNPPIDLKKPRLRVLDIGNSYTDNSVEYLANIVNAAGVPLDFSVYKATRSAATFKTWYNCFNDLDTEPYWVYKVVGETISDVVSGEGAAGNGEKFRTALYAGWDVIIIHQVSYYSDDYADWNGNGDKGYLKQFVRLLKKTNPNATIGYLFAHSYRSSYSANTEGSSLLRWRDNGEAVKNIVADYGIDFVIPTGTAIQNLRASSLNDSNEFSDDGTHLANGLAKYTAACCYYQSLLAPRFGLSIFGNSWRKTDLNESNPGVKNVTNETAIVGQKAAFAACNDMYNINNPDTLEYVDTTEYSYGYPSDVITDEEMEECLTS